MEEIISYIMNTPENTNGNILREKIKDFQKANSIAQPDFEYVLECSITLDEEFDSVDKMSLKGATGTFNDSMEEIKQLYEEGFIKLNVITHSGKHVASFPVKPTFSTCSFSPDGAALYSQEPLYINFSSNGSWIGGHVTGTAAIQFYAFLCGAGRVSIDHYQLSINNVAATEFVDEENDGSDEEIAPPEIKP